MFKTAAAALYALILGTAEQRARDDWKAHLRRQRTRTNRYKPHQGARECTRRVRQMQAAEDYRQNVEYLRAAVAPASLSDRELKRMARSGRRWWRRHPAVGAFVVA